MPLSPLALLACLAQDVTPPPERLSVLVVTGENNHDWPWTSVELAGLLESTGRFRAEVTPEPAVRFLQGGELHEQFDALVLDYNGSRWGGEAEAAFLYAVHEGLGVVVLHAADNAFPGWIEYEELVGLCWREGAGHGSFHPFDVEFLDRDHPLSATLPAFVAHPDELYHRLKRMHQAQPRVLASAHSSRESGGTNEVEPVLTTTRWGAGRIAHTTLGHVWPGVPATRASLHDPQLRELVVRMTEWAATGEVDDGSRLPARPHELERELGWRALVDGERPLAWRGRELSGLPSRGWGAQSGALRLRARSRGGDLVTEERFGDFELELEWQVGLGGGTRLAYRMEDADASGLELPLLDDARHEEGADPRTRTGSVWGVVEAAESPAARPLRFRSARVVAAGSQLEHWIDGRRVVATTLGSPSWREALAQGAYAGRPLFGTRAAGRIVLEDRGDELWVRALRVRDLGAPPGEARALFDGVSLAGWSAVGDARWEVEEGALHGRSREGGGAQGFLLAEPELGDFVLVADVLTRGEGNSGIQVRSRVDPDGVVRGPQVELDPSARRLSGGLHDEGGARGWLDSTEGDEAAQAAFVPGEWNRVRIECAGPWIRAWVNGVPTCDRFDSGPLAGQVGLQVHAGEGTDVLLVPVEVQDLGRRSWRALWQASAPSARPAVGRALEEERREDLALRVACTVDERGPRWRIAFRADPGAALLAGREAGRAVAPGLVRRETAWVLDPALLALAPGAHELLLCAYGRRIALLVDGALVAEIVGARGPASGSLVVETDLEAGERLGLERLELLGPPVLHGSGDAR